RTRRARAARSRRHAGRSRPRCDPLLLPRGVRLLGPRRGPRQRRRPPAWDAAGAGDPYLPHRASGPRDRRGCRADPERARPGAAPLTKHVTLRLELVDLPLLLDVAAFLEVAEPVAF